MAGERVEAAFEAKLCRSLRWLRLFGWLVSWLERIETGIADVLHYRARRAATRREQLDELIRLSGEFKGGYR